MTKRDFLLTLLVLATCAAPGLANDQERLQGSLATWQQLRKTHQGNYSYTVRWSSFAGFGHETEIVVRDNQVVARRYRSFSDRPVPVRPGETAAKPAGTSWEENGEAIGTHTEGAPAKTLDALYAEAAEVLLRPLAEHERRYVRFDPQGLVLACFTVDTRIADDAPIRGVNITRIQLGSQGDANDGEAKKKGKGPGRKAFPAHWGPPPRIQTRDLRPLPGGYGRGSSTLAKWIQMNLDRDAQREQDKE